MWTLMLKKVLGKKKISETLSYILAQNHPISDFEIGMKHTLD